jgi:fructose-bisphosphate aldolase class I
MASQTDKLEKIARSLVASGKGILAADETVATISKRFEKLGIPSTFESRCTYREMLFTAPGVAESISGIIMHDETIRQQGKNSVSLIDILVKQGITPGIKVDAGAKPLAGSPNENITEGLDGLRERLKEYRALGAQFAKWRGVIRIGDGLPSRNCIESNAHALGRYAALCQEQELVPIVEPEVLMEGRHSIERCDEVTSQVIRAVFDALFQQRVSLEGMLLKPNMILPGGDCPTQNSAAEVARATLLCLRRHVSAAVPGVVFLSGGQSDVLATMHLNEINLSAEAKPWKLSFSYGRALQDLALATWLGKDENYHNGQRAFSHRARCNAAATLGRYTEAVEREFVDDMARSTLVDTGLTAHDD